MSRTNTGWKIGSDGFLRMSPISPWQITASRRRAPAKPRVDIKFYRTTPGSVSCKCNQLDLVAACAAHSKMPGVGVRIDLDCERLQRCPQCFVEDLHAVFQALKVKGYRRVGYFHSYATLHLFKGRGTPAEHARAKKIRARIVELLRARGYSTVVEGELSKPTGRRVWCSLCR